MAGIGDLYYTFRGDGARLTADAKKEGAKAGTVGAKSFGAKFSGGLKSTFSGMKGGILGGLGIGAGLGAVSVATAAVGQLTQVIGDMTEAAIADEESVNRLGASLKANVANWDGNTDAIEANILAAQRLGFADEDLRDAMTVLVGATHDVAKAQGIMNTAMDLARFKGIDLKTASEALIKVEGGAFRSLKQLGIKLKDNATSTEALAAVQKVATGQAEAFAKSNRGKLLASQIRVGEVMEKFGATTMPVVVEVLDAAAGFVEDLALAFDDLDASKRSNDELLGNFLNLLDDLSVQGNESKTFIGTLDEAISNLIDDVNDAIPRWDGYTSAVEDQARAARDAAVDTREMEHALAMTRPTVGGAEDDVEDLTDSFDEMGNIIKDTADEYETATDRIKRMSREMRNKLIDDARGIVTKAYDVIADNAELAAATVESAELRKVIATGNATREQKDRYKELGETQQQLIIDLAENGQRGSKAVNDAMNDIRRRLKTATGQERKALLATLRMLEQMEAQARATAGQIAVIHKQHTTLKGPGGGGTKKRAHGGTTEAFEPFWAGELGKELIVSPFPTMVIPHAQSLDIAGRSGGDTINIPLNITGLPMQAETPSDVVRELRRASRLGLAPTRRPKAFSR